MNTSTEYVNGGVTANLLKLFVQNGYQANAEQLLTIAAHDAMPRGVVYTEEQLQAKREEIANHNHDHP